ncbi:hypothetical protein GCM10025866_34330 [Naasia aerilata]|uniref:RNA-binding S4 domain-containing protein n=1 Tax=Naasia aerilata TaxID=1162966 RepID=A0ABN6XRB9_9MICO|nr:hypothetical protein GCM10025866_34330 [Naasia aerilata]
MSSRLDAALVERGLARSRAVAARLIADGLVSVDDRQIVKAGVRVEDDARIEVSATDSYVSRAAHKLLGALDAFAVPVTGRLALDAGASTGGFTQVLLERGPPRCWRWTSGTASWPRRSAGIRGCAPSRASTCEAWTRRRSRHSRGPTDGLSSWSRTCPSSP